MRKLRLKFVESFEAFPILRFENLRGTTRLLANVGYGNDTLLSRDTSQLFQRVFHARGLIEFRGKHITQQ